MGLVLGIVGLPNVGKSTLFRALTRVEAEAANYPFCTIEPNEGTVVVPDERIYKLSEISNSKKTIPATLKFYDIAGLVKGASKGEGLGNKFLSHIREVDAVIHLVRCFEDENITHVSNSIDPINDAEVIETELILSDLEMLEKISVSIQKLVKKGDKDMLGGILDLPDVTVEDVMTHRKNILTIDCDTDHNKVLSLMLENPYTRVPIWKKDKDNFIGILHIKDLLKKSISKEEFEISNILVEPWFVPETTSLKEQLSAFLEKKTHMALVVDEYGALMGLITLEDILEEIVGRQFLLEYLQE